MPLWRIFCHPSTFTTDQKRGLAKAITKHYTDAPLNFPAFYVNVFFVPLLEDELWIGGEPRKNFVRIAIEQIAKHLPALGQPGGQRRAAMMEEIEEVLKPFIADRGDLDWELHVAETPRDLWRVQGIDPPPLDSEAAMRWKIENKASQWQN